MPKIIGYFEGTNPEWLTALVAMGHNTLPVSNGFDGHGRNVRLYSSTLHDDLVIGYLHKVVAPLNWEASTDEILHGIKTYGIPMWVAVSKENQDAARKLVGECGENVRFIDPADMLSELKKLG